MCAHSIPCFEHTAGLQFSAFLVVKRQSCLPENVSISNACSYHTRLRTPVVPLPCSFFLPACCLPPSSDPSPFSHHLLAVYTKSHAETVKLHQPVSLGAPCDLMEHFSLHLVCLPKLSRSPGEEAALSLEPLSVLVSTLLHPSSETHSQELLIYNSGMTFRSLMLVVKSPSDKSSNAVWWFTHEYQIYLIS